MEKLLKGVLLSLLLSLFLIFVLSILISNTQLSEKIIKPSIIGISSFSVMLGGFFVSKNKKEKGLLNGAILGGIYIMILYIISLFISESFAITMNSVIMMILGIIGGMLGGIIGVNF